MGVTDLILSPLAHRIGWGISDVWLERKLNILDATALITDDEPGSTAHGAVAILVASLSVGPDALKIAAALSFDLPFVVDCACRLQEAEVWTRDSMRYPWMDKDDAEAQIGCILDSLVATGALRKPTLETYAAN